MCFRAVAILNERSKLSTSPVLELQFPGGYPDVVEIFRRAAGESHIRIGRHASKSQNRSRCRSLSHWNVAAPSADANSRAQPSNQNLSLGMEARPRARLSARAELRVRRLQIGKALRKKLAIPLEGDAELLTVCQDERVQHSKRQPVYVLEESSESC
jgi:hypothetical protein